MKIIRPISVTDAMLLSSSIPENDCPAYLSTTTYALDQRVMVVSPGLHKIYRSLQANNKDHLPSISPTFWVEESPTNRWKMFDTSITSQAENKDSIVVTLATSGICNGIALLNIDCTIIRVTAVDAQDGVVYDKVHNPASKSGITDWYSYFFEPILTVTDKTFTDLPLYPNMTITVTLTNVGHTVRCGGLIVGHVKKIGTTQRGAKIGIADYSVKARDVFGNFNVIERAFSKRVTFPLWLDTSALDQTQNLFAKYRATPIVYIGIERFGSTIVYGFYKDFSVDITYQNYAVCSIEIEGLT